MRVVLKTYTVVHWQFLKSTISMTILFLIHFLSGSYAMSLISQVAILLCSNRFPVATYLRYTHYRICMLAASFWTHLNSGNQARR